VKSEGRQWERDEWEMRERETRRVGDGAKVLPDKV